MPSQDAPDGDDDNGVRQTHNFAPGYFGLVYRAAAPEPHSSERNEADETAASGQPTEAKQEPVYKIQAMKWGLIPFWTKRSPDYGSMMRTINCRDDSLAQNGGMWHTMKQKKRCVVIAQGFYEWLKKDGGKTKLPHFVKRKDGQLMCFAGLWDSVKYEDAEQRLYTYTIITTSSNKQLGFLHDRMPVILDNGSEDMFKWLDAERSEWSVELQSLLQPYPGELECYPVDQAVGKVGNDSPSFVVPIDSADNKKNIANFFGNQKKQAESEQVEAVQTGGQVQQKPDDRRETAAESHSTEHHAPVPMEKRKLDDADADSAPAAKAAKVAPTRSPNKPAGASPQKTSSRRNRSATSNGTAAKGSPQKGGSQKITSFFGK